MITLDFYFQCMRFTSMRSNNTFGNSILFFIGYDHGILVAWSINHSTYRNLSRDGQLTNTAMSTDINSSSLFPRMAWIFLNDFLVALALAQMSHPCLSDFMNFLMSLLSHGSLSWHNSLEVWDMTCTPIFSSATNLEYYHTHSQGVIYPFTVFVGSLIEMYVAVS